MDDSTEPGGQLRPEPQEERGAPGSRDTGADEPGGGPVDRPAGVADPGTDSTVDPQGTGDDAPHLPTGDQGG